MIRRFCALEDARPKAKSSARSIPKSLSSQAGKDSIASKMIPKGAPIASKRAGRLSICAKNGRLPARNTRSTKHSKSFTRMFHPSGGPLRLKKGSIPIVLKKTFDLNSFHPGRRSRVVTWIASQESFAGIPFISRCPIGITMGSNLAMSPFGISQTRIPSAFPRSTSKTPFPIRSDGFAEQRWFRLRRRTFRSPIGMGLFRLNGATRQSLRSGRFLDRV